jgi:flagellar biosynthesis/type III secretory pathway protein FliH
VTEQRLEEDRVSHQAAETARQETMLKMVSKTLTTSTAQKLESTIRAEIKGSVIPAISKIVAEAADSQIAKGVSESIRKVSSSEEGEVSKRDTLF